MKKRLIVFIFVFFTLSLLLSLWFKESTSPPRTAESASKIFVVAKGESVREIAKRLKSENLIRDSLAFFILVKKRGVEKDLQAGDFRLNPSMSAYEVLDELQHGTLDIWITIPEGLRREEIALRLAKELNIPENEFLKSGEEGYLFPDTYLIPKEATASSVIKMMTDNFQSKVVEELNIDQNNLESVIIISSLIEREAKFAEDRSIVASVVANRLKNNMKLDIDATVQYMLGYQPQEKSWWKRTLTKEDLQIKSLYNTYINIGLPPAPIGNPGIAAIQAALNPAETDYLYYVSDSEGHLHFARSLPEHQENINKFVSY